MSEKRQRVFSGIQPSGDIHIGNYLGAIKKWVEIADEHDSIFCIVDDHAITVEYDPKLLPARIFEGATATLACGLDPSKCTIFVQSDVPQHTELTWLFNTVTPLGSLFRMTQFKEKSRNALAKSDAKSSALHSIKNVGQSTLELSKNLAADIEAIDPEGELDEELVARLNDGLGNMMQQLQVGLGVSEASTALFDYPVLQAADILLYKATLVPVGQDQEQHLELCREVAERFNRRFKKVFPMARRIPGEAPKILGLDGKAKMSKSLGNQIGVLDTPKQIKKKIGRAFTDPNRQRREDPGNPDICNIHTLHRFFSTSDECQEMAEGCRTAGIGCGDCKKLLIENMTERLSPIREKAEYYRGHPDDVYDILAQGKQRCREIAAQTMDEVHMAMGIGQRFSSK